MLHIINLLECHGDSYRPKAELDCEYETKLRRLYKDEQDLTRSECYRTIAKRKDALLTTAVLEHRFLQAGRTFRDVQFEYCLGHIAILGRFATFNAITETYLELLIAEEKAEQLRQQEVVACRGDEDEEKRCLQYAMERRSGRRLDAWVLCSEYRGQPESSEQSEKSEEPERLEQPRGLWLLSWWWR